MNPNLFPLLFFIAAVYAITWLFTFGSLLVRADLEALEKLMWVIVMIFAPLGLIFYIALAPRLPAKKIDPSNQLSGTPWENNPNHTSRGDA
jgi:hypothetical protein